MKCVRIVISLLAGGLLLMPSCHKPGPEPVMPPDDRPQPHLPAIPFAYSEQAFPPHWTSDAAMNLFHVNDAFNPITDAGATLGRVLFYDGQLSMNGIVSCGSCHQPEHGFADRIPYSDGVGNVSTTRNTLALTNMAYQRKLFWEGREGSLEAQVLQPIEHPDEMGMDLEFLPSHLSGISYYPGLFEAAFGDPEITTDRVAKALAQFVRSIQSTSSRYDAGLINGFSNFTEQELLGKDLFFSAETRCPQCHGTLNFYTPSELMVNGLDLDYTAAGDGGLYEVTGNAFQDGLFRVVSLRNIGLTAPYMHDGRFTTLREVVDFYAEDIQAHPNLNHRLSENGFGANGQAPLQMDLSPEDRDALVAFLHTLSDTTDFVNSPWGSPFY